MSDDSQSSTSLRVNRTIKREITVFGGVKAYVLIEPNSNYHSNSQTHTAAAKEEDKNTDPFSHRFKSKAQAKRAHTNEEALMRKANSKTAKIRIRK